MKNEEMLRLRLEGKSHAEIAKLSTEQGRAITRQGIQWILKQYKMTRGYTLDSNKKRQDGAKRGVKGILDKIVLKVKKFL